MASSSALGSVMASSSRDAVAAPLPSRSRTLMFCKYRDSIRVNRKASRQVVLGSVSEFKVHKNLLSGQQSDDECSNIDARVYSVPPVWVSLVEDLNRDVADIQSKRAHPSESTALPS